MPYQLENLLQLMSELRHPEYGCQWDKAQTLSSLIPHTIEEAYEVIDAIASGDLDEIKQELGDLLFQVVFYTQITKEQGEFDFTDVVAALVEKMLRRHPHVFPDGSLGSAGSEVLCNKSNVLKNWADIKRLERSKKNKNNILDDVARALPALTRANKLQQRASGVGFDWSNVNDVFQKLDEEKLELQDAIISDSRKNETEELGDLLFTCVNIARHLNIDPETALREANNKFERRFNYIESSLKFDGVKFENMNIEQLEQKWLEAKAVEAQNDNKSEADD